MRSRVLAAFACASICLAAGAVRTPAATLDDDGCTPVVGVFELVNGEGDDGAGPRVLLGPEIFGVAVDDAGNAYISGFDSDNVFLISPAGIVSQLLADGDRGLALEGPAAVVLDDQSNLYVAGFESHNVLRLTPGGELSEWVSESDGLLNPGGLAIDPQGNLYVAGFGSDNVLRVAPDGEVTEILDAGGPGSGWTLNAPLGLVRASSGELFVGGLLSDNVVRVLADGTASEILGKDGDGLGNRLDQPRGLAVDSAGGVWVAGEFSENVFRVEPTGQVVTIVDREGGDGAGPRELRAAYDLAVDGADNVFVTGRGSGNVLQLTESGVIGELLGPSGEYPLPVEFRQPTAIAADRNGNLYVSAIGSSNALRVVRVADDFTCDGIDDDCDGAADEDFVPGRCRAEESGACATGQSVCDAGTLRCDSLVVAEPEVCDFVDNDCDGTVDEDAADPQVFFEDQDGDGYGNGTVTREACVPPPGFVEVSADCDDEDAARAPNLPEVCDAKDNDCNALVDDDAQGVDSDTDGISNACDNCVDTPNADQRDADGDGIGSSCDNCPQASNGMQLDGDEDSIGDACDNCATTENAGQADADQDGRGDVCDNCVLDRNLDQGDLDLDGEGDLCDLDDGTIVIRFFERARVDWQEETGFEAWNVYRGSMALLREGLGYTQDPLSSPLARSDCGLAGSGLLDVDPLATAELSFYLVTGVSGGAENELGVDGAGNLRENTRACP